MAMNVGTPNFVPTYHKMDLEEYKKMSFVPTKANLEKRRLEQEQAAMQDKQPATQNPTSARSRSTWERATLASDWNAPTLAEVETCKTAKKHNPRGLMKTIKKWTRKEEAPTIA